MHPSGHDARVLGPGVGDVERPVSCEHRPVRQSDVAGIDLRLAVRRVDADDRAPVVGADVHQPVAVDAEPECPRIDFGHLFVRSVARVDAVDPAGLVSCPQQSVRPDRDPFAMGEGRERAERGIVGREVGVHCGSLLE